MNARASAGSFWDEDFAWAPPPGFVPAVSVFDVTVETEPAVGGGNASPAYHRYHIRLLNEFAARDAAGRGARWPAGGRVRAEVLSRRR